MGGGARGLITYGCEWGGGGVGLHVYLKCLFNTLKIGLWMCICVSFNWRFWFVIFCIWYFSKLFMYCPFLAVFNTVSSRYYMFTPRFYLYNLSLFYICTYITCNIRYFIILTFNVFYITKQRCISNRCYVIIVNTTPALDIILVRPEDSPNGKETCCLE
jgi:hypothetical protein